MSGGGGRKSMQHHRLDPYPVGRSRDGLWCWLLIAAAFVASLGLLLWSRW